MMAIKSLKPVDMDKLTAASVITLVIWSMVKRHFAATDLRTGATMRHAMMAIKSPRSVAMDSKVAQCVIAIA